MDPDSADTLFETTWAAQPTARVKGRHFGLRLTPAERRLLLVGVDLLLVNLALAAATTLWLDVTFSAEVLWVYSKWFITLSLLWLLLGFALDVYDPVRAASATHSLVAGGLAALLTGSLYLMIPWLTPPLHRRLFPAFFLLFLVGGIAVWRMAYARFFFQPNFQRRVLVVGRDEVSRRLAEELQAAAGSERANPLRGTGYRIVDFVERLPVNGLAALDPAHSLLRLARISGVDEILVAAQALPTPEFYEALLDCRELGIPVIPLSLAYERLTARLPVAYAARDLDLILSSHDTPIRRLYEMAKRAVDLVLALLGLLAVGLLVPWLALGNRLTAPGPLFYRQQRVGRGGRPFALLKFRTMTPDAEQQGAAWATPHDPRVTPLGRWLRRIHLDELPQVFNVLRGEMSIVGPRPERPQFVGKIAGDLPIYRARHSVRPGLTGWAQVRYPYGNSVEDARRKLEYDLYYIKHAGFFLDLLIMLQTIPVMLRGNGY